jgi:hypothetical protein
MNIDNATRLRGVTLIYATFALMALAAVSSLAVDWGRVQLVRSEMRAAADAAACAAVLQIEAGVNATIAVAKAAAAENSVDGAPLVLIDSDIEFGEWDEDTQTFSVLTGNDRADADCIRIRAVRSNARSNAVPLMFGAMIGRPRQDVVVYAIASYSNQSSDGFTPAVAKAIPGKASPWNAGLPNGITWGDFNDTTPNCSPIQVNEIPITPGQPYLFRHGTGSTQFGGGTSQSITLEGDTGWILDQAAQNGIARTRAPAHALMGVFLNDSDPRNSSTPSARNYSKANKRDFGTHKPKLKQVFYIGDGRKSDGTYQKFIPPTGATRLFLGVMDERGRWSDNTGTINVEVGYPDDQLPNGQNASSGSSRIVQ